MCCCDLYRNRAWSCLVFFTVRVRCLSCLSLHSFSFCEEHQTGGQHPLAKIEIRWECWSANKWCLLISEVLGIKGVVLMHVYPVLSGRTIIAQPENCVQVKGWGRIPCIVEFRWCSERLRVKKWYRQQRAGWWKGQFFLAETSDYQMLLLPRPK